MESSFLAPWLNDFHPFRMVAVSRYLQQLLLYWLTLFTL